MNSLLNSDRDEDIDDSDNRRSYNAGTDREITLGTTMVLGIFFALAIFAAVFFGFGYSMGAKHAAGTTTMAGESSSTSFSTFKPAPGSPLGAPITKPGLTDTTPLPATVPPKSATPKAAPSAFTETTPAPANSAYIPAVQPIPRAALASTTPPPPPPAAAPAPGAGAVSAVVQVAAVSHQEDADLLVTTLKRRGYNVAIHSEPQDRLLHVQIGPFPSKAEANAMRQKLLADGFNAIVK